MIPLWRLMDISLATTECPYRPALLAKRRRAADASAGLECCGLRQAATLATIKVTRESSQKT